MLSCFGCEKNIPCSRQRLVQAMIDWIHPILIRFNHETLLLLNLKLEKLCELYQHPKGGSSGTQRLIYTLTSTGMMTYVRGKCTNHDFYSLQSSNKSFNVLRYCCWVVTLMMFLSQWCRHQLHGPLQRGPQPPAGETHHPGPGQAGDSGLPSVPGQAVTQPNIIPASCQTVEGPNVFRILWHF